MSYLLHCDIEVYGIDRCELNTSMMNYIIEVLRLNSLLGKLSLSLWSNEDDHHDGRNDFDAETFRSVIEAMQNLKVRNHFINS